jgi:ADP-ribosylglycohydrolase
LGAEIDDIDMLWDYVVTSTHITHTDPKAACGAFAVALASRAASRYAQCDADELIAELKSRCPQDTSRELVKLLQSAAASVARNERTAEFGMSMGMAGGVSGYVNHTVPIALHAAWSRPQDFHAAVLSVIECGGDADTTAAIVGGIIGAAVGTEGIPAEWLNCLRDSPRSVSWIGELGRRLAGEGSTKETLIAPDCPWLRLVLRNTFFATVVLAHGFRRLLPPY